MKIIILLLIIIASRSFSSELFYYKNNKQNILTPKIFFLKNMKKSKTIDYYYNSNNILLGINDNLIIKTKENIDLKSILNFYNLTLVKVLSKNTYLLKTSNKNLTLAIANELYKHKKIIYSNPDFIKIKYKR